MDIFPDWVMVTTSKKFFAFLLLNWSLTWLYLKQKKTEIEKKAIKFIISNVEKFYTFGLISEINNLNKRNSLNRGQLG